MGRFLLVALVVVTATLGMLMDNVWMMGAAGAFFLVALVVLAVLAARRRSRRAEQERAARARTREDELRELGLSEPRPRTASAASEPAPSRQPGRTSKPAAAPEPAAAVPPDEDDADDTDPIPPPDVEEVAGGAAATPEAGPLPEREPDHHRDDHKNVLHSTDDHPLWQIHSPTAFASFLRACWAASEVQTALLAAEEHDGSFSLLAIRSHLPGVRTEGRLPADSFLSLASTDRPVTILEANDPLLRDLPHYRNQTHVGGVAILPVEGPDATLYLAVDLAPDSLAFTERQRTLLLGFADVLRTLLAHPPEDPPARTVPTRRAIVSEEMSYARTEGLPLSLALVYRTDAERIAGRGEAAVAEAERDLRLLLEDMVHHGRLERFGELMFGAFLHEETSIIEQWARRVSDRADAEGFTVAIGVARMRDQVDADAFRADAANALAEALQTEDLFATAESRA
jgi:hypothetical protein